MPFALDGYFLLLFSPFSFSLTFSAVLSAFSLLSSASPKRKEENFVGTECVTNKKARNLDQWKKEKNLKRRKKARSRSHQFHLLPVLRNQFLVVSARFSDWDQLLVSWVL